MRVLFTVIVVIAATTLAQGLAQPVSREVRLAAGQQTSLTPGFAVGDVSGSNSSVADYQVGRDRRHIVITGYKPGTATVALWDQSGRHRLELNVSVVRELDPATAAELQSTLARFPGVRILTLRGQPVLSGEVPQPEGLQLLRGLAAAAGIECHVVLHVPAPPPVTPAVRRTRFDVEYDVRLLEADNHFSTQVYEEGVEPSGRELYRTTLAAQGEATAQGFIGGVVASTGQPRGNAASRLEIGLRFSLRPSAQAGADVQTDVTIETNLPIASAVYVPAEWRRFRRAFATRTGVPFAITGNDLLASSPPPARDSKVKNATRWIARIAVLPGVNDMKGVHAVPVFSNLVSSVAYRGGRTQLVLVVRPRVGTSGE